MYLGNRMKETHNKQEQKIYGSTTPLPSSKPKMKIVKWLQ